MPSKHEGGRVKSQTHKGQNSRRAERARERKTAPRREMRKRRSGNESEPCGRRETEQSFSGDPLKRRIAAATAERAARQAEPRTGHTGRREPRGQVVYEAKSAPNDATGTPVRQASAQQDMRKTRHGFARAGLRVAICALTGVCEWITI